jgi:hypothetical protein
VCLNGEKNFLIVYRLAIAIFLMDDLPEPQLPCRATTRLSFPCQLEIADDSMCIMHDDGSVNIIERLEGGVITNEVISSANI